MTWFSKPRKAGFALFSASLLLAGVSAAAGASSSSAAEILDRYVKVTGGAPLWRAQRFERHEIEGRTLDGNTVVLNASILTARDGSSRSEVHVPQEAAEGVYKGVAWAVSQFSGVRIKRAAERDEALRDSHMLEEADWRTLYPHARFAGMEGINGKFCYRVELAAETTEWFDAATGLLVRRQSSELSPDGDTAVGFTVEEYAVHDGLMQPARMLAWRGDLQYRLSVLKTVYNKPEPLEYPAEVAQYLADDRAGRALPNAEEIVERHIFESGGVDAYEKLKTQRIRGSITFLSSNSEAPVETWASNGGRYYESVDVPGLGKQEEGSDGVVSWQRSPALGPRIKPRNAAPGLGVTLDAAMVIGWRLLTKEVRTEAAERIDGRDCWRVRLIPRGSNEIYLRWYDRRTGLLYRSNVSLPTEMGALPLTMTFEEYRDAAGLKWPTRIRMLTGGQNLLFTAADVRLNEPIEDAVFELPAEIKELAEKRAAGTGLE